jgi:hypothetical protein
MADTPLSKKLLIKPGCKLLVLNAPDGYLEMLKPLPDGVEIKTNSDGSYDFVQLFIYNRADVETQIKVAVQALKPGGLLWLSYPKKSSKIKTDVTRDIGWDAVHEAGFDGVTLISIDDTWSAMRYRPLAEVNARKKA